MRSSIRLRMLDFECSNVVYIKGEIVTNPFNLHDVMCKVPCKKKYDMNSSELN